MPVQSMDSRREFLKTVVVGGATLSLTPTLASGNAFAASPGGVQILRRAKELAKSHSGSLTVLLPRGSEANVKPVAAAFTAATGVEVEFSFTDVDDINTTILANSLIGKHGFDVALPATFGIPDLVEANALFALDEFEQKYRTEFGENGSLYNIGDSYLGKTYGYQTDGDVYTMFYKKSWLEDPEERKRYADLGKGELRIPETWDELDRMMAHFQRPEKNMYGGALFRSPNYLVWEWWIRLHANGSWPVDGNFNPLIAGKAGIDALEAMAGSASSLYPDAGSNGLVANWEAFAKGNIFCNIGWGGSQKFFNQPRSAVRGDLVFGLTPGARANGRSVRFAYFNWGWNYTVARQAKNPELAFLFARFAVSPDISARAVRIADGFFDPFLPGHYTDPEIQKTYAPAFLKVHRESMEAGIPDFYVRNRGEYFDVLREGLGRVLRGQSTAKAGLETVAAQWTEITDRLGRDGQKRQWRSLREKYPKSVIDFLGES